MTAIAAHQSRETLARPAAGQVLPGEFVLQDGGLRGSLEALENVLQIDDIAGTRR